MNIGPLRKSVSVEVCDDDESLIWLRGPRLEESIHQELRSLLGCVVYRPFDDGQLVPSYSTIPHGYVPEGTWRPLRDWLKLSLPAKRFPAACESLVPISLVRSACPQEPGLLSSSLEVWTQYASRAPQIRLESLQFAASHYRAIIVGEPLPQINGEYFYFQNGIAVPVGFAWTPALDAQVLRNALELEKDDIAIFPAGGGCSRIRSNQFVGATRSAVRLTAESIHAES